MKASFFSKKIISWYRENKRELPWRNTNDPYKIWLSEIILQQTRVQQGLPYYHQFVETFPSVHDLAKASEQLILRHWQGLGYYTRARNLHRCAKTIQQNYQGRFPATFEELLKLPGVGQYTAAAIASFAYREKVAVVDGNVFRVLSRLFGWDKDIASPEGKKFFFEKANELIDAENPDLFNQAIMEFGAIQCVPQNPDCDACIFSKQCVAKQTNAQALLPVKSKKIKITNRYFYYLVVKTKQGYLMRKREEKDIWKGLFDFPLIELNNHQKPEKAIAKGAIKNFQLEKSVGPVKHILSHQHLHIYFLIGSGGERDRIGNLKVFSPKQIQKLPKPVVISRFLSETGILP